MLVAPWDGLSWAHVFVSPRSWVCFCPAVFGKMKSKMPQLFLVLHWQGKDPRPPLVTLLWVAGRTSSPSPPLCRGNLNLGLRPLWSRHPLGLQLL